MTLYWITESHLSCLPINLPKRFGKSALSLRFVLSGGAVGFADTSQQPCQLSPTPVAQTTYYEDDNFIDPWKAHETILI